MPYAKLLPGLFEKYVAKAIDITATCSDATLFQPKR